MVKYREESALKLRHAKQFFHSSSCSFVSPEVFYHEGTKTRRNTKKIFVAWAARPCLLFGKSRAGRPCHGTNLPLIFAFILALAFLSTPLRAATVAISLPLQGHYHPGRYMPIRISAQTDGPKDVLILRGKGALTAEIPAANGRIDATLPWLSIVTISNVRWSVSGVEQAVDTLPLHALDNDDDRLIGYAGADPDALAPLFSGKKLIRVALDVTDPLPGEIMAWEALDGIVLDAAAARRPFTEAKIASLLAGGAAVAIRSAQKPGGGWPWRRQGAYWICRVEIAGPTSCFQEKDAYQPAQVWVRGWPAALRRKILLAAIVLVILATAGTLWRSRWAVVIVLVICAVSTGLGLLWRSRQSPAIEQSTAVIVRTDTTTQRDTWSYHSVLRSADVSIPWQPLMRPIFITDRQADDLSLRQLFDVGGLPLSFSCHLEHGQAMAFQTRVLTPGREDLSPAMPVSPALGALADEIYRMHGDKIVGQARVQGDESRWPEVVIDRGSIAR
jgi:hypothetical protein